jgi:antibiotic biosynthesis monooxygenase (ABM) superfamily enzyme
MIKHFVAFRFKPSASAQLREDILAELRTFPAHYPAMRNWNDGRNISKRDQTFEYGFTVEFDKEEELLAYLNSERHEHFVRERFRPNVETRAIVSFETGKV